MLVLRAHGDGDSMLREGGEARVSLPYGVGAAGEIDEEKVTSAAVSCCEDPSGRRG